MKMKINLDKIYDISMPIYHEMPVYNGKEEKRPILEVQSDFTTSKAYESRIHMNLHTGTHMDRTLHMIPGGNTMETLEWKDMVTKCRVLDLTSADEKITAADLKDKQIEEGDFLLFKTKNSFEDILETTFIYLEKSGAAYLAEKNIKGVGIDALGVERAQPEHETHLQLMQKGIHILEGLRLKDVEEGEYFLSAAPLNIIAAEAAPIKAYLIALEEDER